MMVRGWRLLALLDGHQPRGQAPPEAFEVLVKAPHKVSLRTDSLSRGPRLIWSEAYAFVAGLRTDAQIPLIGVFWDGSGYL